MDSFWHVASQPKKQDTWFYGGPYVPTLTQRSATQQQWIHNAMTPQPQHNNLTVVIYLIEIQNN